MEHNKTFADNSMLLYGQEIPVEVDESSIAHAVLKPGQASLHHIMTVHASGPNEGISYVLIPMSAASII
jgi:hypothetical protein